ncbi:MAG: tryptophan--tRNA ligase [Candidatus Methylomirabilis oxygeniifera]|uniref:Tryptophan--tRNA ligase n=1 Tax=Methylomirabilis oxygeniifera TaxID=671143 RepID=D5ML78_METO1|nr:MAG: tryptophan--tRNA ligase [Candidatus Methylomirabilis oxyfera]CBE69920.1 Tryptophanyl-tRNA synthetase (Tryptophan--tRNA ligase) (TrpRS) [Candidatus Methylomirabilis oxyfera]
MPKDRVLSGMRPTGRLHLGHLFGALDNWRRLQEAYECFFFVADWHALTTEYADTKSIRDNICEMALDMLAAGIDPSKATLFLQSRLHEHAELYLLLSMITPVPWLERNPTYKEQQQELTTKDLSTHGFLGYPVLMASDILIYKANHVPVGIDQVPHLELAREIARRFNALYGEVLVEPQPLLTEFAKVPGTDGRKMSKSYGNAVFLSDSPEQVAAKIKPMVTDPARVRRRDPGNPDVCPVFDLHKIFTPKAERDTVIDPGCRTAGIGCLDCKGVLLQHMLPALRPIYERRQDLAARPEIVQEVLEDGWARAKKVAGETLSEVRAAMHM